MPELKLVRAYDITPDDQGYRLLVDRLWPRGLRKETLEPFLWAKEITPSTELRQWFGHDPEKFQRFADKYRKELDMNPHAEDILSLIKDRLKEQDVILLFAAKNEKVNHAVILKEWLTKKMVD